jgi:uncharacterized protein (TIGR02996 family)
VTEREALIAAIVADPTSSHGWDVYSDWLLDRGDPRGEWIRAALASDDERVATKPPIDDRVLLSPRLADQWHLLLFSWWRGFIRGASLTGAPDDPPTGETIAALLADPHAALLSKLALGHAITDTVPLWRALVAEPRPSLRRLAASNLGDGGALLDALPNLETLHLASHEPVVAPVERLVHSNLRELIVPSERECPAAIVGAIETPRLEELSWTAASPELALVTTATSVLFHPPPRLRHLEVADVPLELVIDLPVFAQLRSLRWGGGYDRVELAPRLQHLASLSFGVTRMPAELLAPVREELERAFPKTKLDVKWSPYIEPPDPPRGRPSVIDDDSRDEHGRVSALGQFTRNR